MRPVPAPLTNEPEGAEVNNYMHTGFQISGVPDIPVMPLFIKNVQTFVTLFEFNDVYIAAAGKIGSFPIVACEKQNLPLPGQFLKII